MLRNLAVQQKVPIKEVPIVIGIGIITTIIACLSAWKLAGLPNPCFVGPFHCQGRNGKPRVC